MIPKVAGRGSSFKGLAMYLLENTDEMQPDDSTRVEWSATGNLLTDDIEKAAKVMAWTDLHAEDLKRAAGVSTAGAKPSSQAVFHYSLAWALGENPSKEHMQEQVLETLTQLGLREHEFFMVAHNDRPHKHVHVAVNLTHPETGKRAELGTTKRKLQKWALEYEHQNGVHCNARVKNAADRENGKPVKHRNQKQDYSTEVTRAFYLSDDGKSFAAALQLEGLQIAKARRGKGFVLVDQKGDIQALARQLDTEEKGKAKTAAVNKKLENLNRDLVPDGDELSKEIKARLKDEQDTENQSFRDDQEAEQMAAMLDGAEEAAPDLAKAQNKEEWIEERRKSNIEKQVERAKAKQAAETLETESRHAVELAAHEWDISVKFDPKIEDTIKAADELQSVVDGSGFRLALRRVWRGRKDREELGNLRQEIAAYKAEVEDKRKKLAAAHEREKSVLKTRHAMVMERLKKSEKFVPDRQRKAEVQAGKNPFDGLRKVSTGRRVALDTANKRKSRYIEKRAYELRQIEEAKAQENVVRQEADNQRSTYEQRQEEIRETKADSPVEREINRQRQNRDKGKDKGRDFDR